LIRIDPAIRQSADFQTGPNGQSGSGKFWEEYGYEHPETQEMGMKLCTALDKMTGCERNWKEHDVVHSKARNKLGAKRARDLVYTYGHLRLHETMAKSEAKRARNARQFAGVEADGDASDDDDMVAEEEAALASDDE
jgi:hypothetical protein